MLSKPSGERAYETKEFFNAEYRCYRFFSKWNRAAQSRALLKARRHTKRNENIYFFIS